MTEEGGDAPAAVRVFVLHGDRLFTEALEQALDDHPEIHLAGAARDPPARRRLLAARPDVVLVDASHRHGVALTAVRELRDRQPGLEILVLGVADCGVGLDFIEAGANGFVPAAASVGDLVTSVEAASHGEAACSSEVVTRAVRRLLRLAERFPSQGASNPLSGREQEVLGLIGVGLCNKEIAGDLGIALATVKNHVHNILSKIGAKTRREAVRQAFECGWIDRCLPAHPP